MKISNKHGIPEETRGRKKKYDFSNIKVGDSFQIDREQRFSVYKAAKIFNRDNGTSIKVCTGMDKKGVFRCWRVE